MLGLVGGYFAGREHLKYELRAAFQGAAEGLQESFSSAFGESAATTKPDKAMEEARRREQEHEESIKSAYVAQHLELYDVSAKYTDSLLDGRVPGVLFKLRNTGDRSLDEVEVTVYFKDAQGQVIAEEDYIPVLVSEFSFSGDNKPLKPGYVWQMEKGTFYSAKSVPSEWKEGSIDASITDIRFTE